MKVQPGLIDDHLEIYAVKGEAFCTYKGGIHKYPSFPPEVLRELREDFNDNAPAVDIIRRHWGITEPESALEKYIICRFGGLDFFPDRSAENGKLTPDYHHCPIRSSCPGNGIVCSALKGLFGEITFREKQVAVHIAAGKMEKEIADIMDICTVTVKKHRKALFDKTGAQSSVQLTDFVHERNLIPANYAH